jgi:hypothetical protein
MPLPPGRHRRTNPSTNIKLREVTYTLGAPSLCSTPIFPMPANKEPDQAVITDRHIMPLMIYPKTRPKNQLKS